ncbi:MAG TPA: hypothetical protein VIO14_12255 [Dehalococcoidia bacterium]
MNERCVTCGEPLTEPNVATCNRCGNRFHLVMRMDTPGKDCGEVWINEEFLALEFACGPCLRGAAPGIEAERPPRKRYARRSDTRAADLVRERRRRRR